MNKSVEVISNRSFFKARNSTNDNVNLSKRKAITLKHDLISQEKKKLKLGSQARSKVNGNHKEHEKSVGPPSPREAAHTPETAKISSSPQSDFENVGDEMMPDLNGLKCTLQEAIVSFVECKDKFKENSDKLLYMIEVVKKHAPSMLDSESPMVSQTIADISKSTRNGITSNEDEDTDYLMGVGQVQAMKILLKEFHSYALVLETIPESILIKERLLQELQTKEQLFEEKLIQFKQNKPWLLNDGIRCLERHHQNFIRYKYKTYIDTLDLELEAMKKKRNSLILTLKDRIQSQTKDKIAEEPLSSNCNESETVSGSSRLQKSSSDDSGSLLSPMNSDDSGVGNKSGSECNTDKEQVKRRSSERLTATDKKVWPGKSLPDLDDLLSSSSSSSVTTETDAGHCGTSQTMQAALDESQMVEALITEVSQELEVSGNRTPDVANHFMATQYASVTSPSNPGFVYSVPVKPDQKLAKTLLNSSLNSVNFCSHCKEHFESKESLYSHKLLQHVTRLCSLCAEIYENFAALNDHVTKQHPAYLLCSVCFDAVESSKMLEHNEKHPQSVKIVDEKFKCRACFKVFDSVDEVKKHEKEEKDHKNAFHFCKVCGELFLTQYDLRKHSNEEHLAVKADICKVCLQDFNDKTSLLKHLKLNHVMVKNQSPKKYTCICCYENCVNVTDMIQHMRNSHQNDSLVERASKGEDSGPPKNKCPHCFSYFKNSKVRAVHEIMFHESPPFSCACNAAFFTKAMLDKHQLQHTRAEEENMKPKRRPRMSLMPN